MKNDALINLVDKLETKKGVAQSSSILSTLRAPYAWIKIQDAKLPIRAWPEGADRNSREVVDNNVQKLSLVEGFIGLLRRAYTL